MITPLCSEDEWAPVWMAAEPWQPSVERLLVIAPHPDDETLAIGGFISMQASKGIPVQVVAVTDGENAYKDESNLATIRQAEQTAALEELGLIPTDILRLQLTDSDISSEEGTLVQRLLPLVLKETHILAPWTSDFHPDHEACGRAAKTVAQRTGAALTFYFFWTWHRGTPRLLQDLPLHSVALSANLQHAKRTALSHYRSQLAHSSGVPILPDELLWPARRPYEIFLPT